MEAIYECPKCDGEFELEDHDLTENVNTTCPHCDEDLLVEAEQLNEKKEFTSSKEIGEFIEDELEDNLPSIKASSQFWSILDKHLGDAGADEDDIEDAVAKLSTEDAQKLYDELVGKIKFDTKEIDESLDHEELHEKKLGSTREIAKAVDDILANPAHDIEEIRVHDVIDIHLTRAGLDDEPMSIGSAINKMGLRKAQRMYDQILQALSK